MMMDDIMMDELLIRFKTERAPRPDAFASVDYFEVRFFAAVEADERKHAQAVK